MILAKREKAVYVCDDLFLRKIGSACGITCNNSLFLLKALYQKNPVQAAKVLKKISKSDYNADGERLIIDVWVYVGLKSFKLDFWVLFFIIK